MRFDVDLERIRKIAEDYYRNGDFYCSEAVVKTIIDEFQIDVSEDVIKGFRFSGRYGRHGMYLRCSDRRSHGNRPCLWQKPGKRSKGK